MTDTFNVARGEQPERRIYSDAWRVGGVPEKSGFFLGCSRGYSPLKEFS
jgi:hypothetical protein